MRSRPWSVWILGVIVPLALVVIILSADAIESPKTAYVGVLTAIPMLAAVFATWFMTMSVGVVTWLAAFWFGLVSVDGNNQAQVVRLVIIAVATGVAVAAAYVRSQRESALVEAQAKASLSEQLRAQAEHDQLTSLLNRRGVLRLLAGLSGDRVRTVALFDCDNLKEVNDRFGHLAGDEYLKAVAGRLNGAISSTDLVARWGGDEFLVVQDLGPESALPSLLRAQEAVSASPMAVMVGMVRATVSVGVATWAPGEPLDEALSAADTALYQAKGQGRDQLVASP